MNWIRDVDSLKARVMATPVSSTQMQRQPRQGDPGESQTCVSATRVSASSQGRRSRVSEMETVSTRAASRHQGSEAWWPLSLCLLPVTRRRE